MCGANVGCGMVVPIHETAIASQSFLDSTIIITAHALQDSRPFIWTSWATQLYYVVQSKEMQNRIQVVIGVTKLRAGTRVLEFQVDDKRIRWKGGTLPIILVLDTHDLVFDVWRVYDPNNNRSDIIIAIIHDQFTWAP
ncbi:hypothetical protein Hanom_Chr12g01127511 [Helianthus anomalus]